MSGLTVKFDSCQHNALRLINLKYVKYVRYREVHLTFYAFHVYGTLILVLSVPHGREMSQS